MLKRVKIKKFNYNKTDYIVLLLYEIEYIFDLNFLKYLL